MSHTVVATIGGAADGDDALQIRSAGSLGRAIVIAVKLFLIDMGVRVEESHGLS